MKRIAAYFSKLKVLLNCILEDLFIIFRFLKYEKENGDYRKFSYLRACCHVLDKGLESVDFEPGHGRCVYETAKDLQSQLSLRFQDDRSFAWINNVISEYERSQKEGRVIRNYSENRLNRFNKEEMNFIQSFLNSRTSCRNYDGLTIDNSTLLKLVEMAIEAPVGCCRQTVRYYITQDPLKINIIKNHVSGMTCFSNIPCIVMVYVKSSAYSMVDRRMQYIDASLSVENFVLAAYANNLGSTICNFSSSSNEDQKAVRNLLDIPADESPVVAITLGRPVSIPRKPLRMDVSEFFKIK